MDYQIERLHIYGESHPSTGLKHKVVGYQFSQTLEIIDPVTKLVTKEPTKQFMVNQLVLTIERSRLVLSPFDEVLHKQLIDYSVDRVSQRGMPVFTSKNEHFVDALGLAHLAFVLKFPDITAAIKLPEYTSKIENTRGNILNARANADLRNLTSVDAWSKRTTHQIGKDPGERRGDYQQWIKVSSGSSTARATPKIWGSRGGGGRDFGGRTLW